MLWRKRDEPDTGRRRVMDLILKILLTICDLMAIALGVGVLYMIWTSE